MSTDPEELFPPRPGGMVATVRAQKQTEQRHVSALEEIESAASWSGRYSAVRTREMGAELGRGRTFTVSTSDNFSTAQLLGQDINRKYAVIMTLDEPVVICFSEAAAYDPRNASAGTAGQDASGFVLPVNVPVPFTYQGDLWVVATSSTASRVSVMSFSFSEVEADRG